MEPMQPHKEGNVSVEMNHLDKLRNYLNKFFIRGIDLLCCTQPSNEAYGSRLRYEKAFISSSYWCITALTLSSSPMREHDIIKVMRVLISCMEKLDLNEESESDDDPKTIKAFLHYPDNDLFISNTSSTLYAVQIYYMIMNMPDFKHIPFSKLLIYDDDINVIIDFIKLLWNKKEGFFYDSLDFEFYKYYDLRNTMTALSTFRLLHKLLNKSDDEILEIIKSTFDVELIFKYIKSHFNPDGGVSLKPKDQSHVGAAFCCVGSLVIIDKLNSLSHSRIKLLTAWLMERISVSGAINGRVGKSNDICYIWWNLATLTLIYQHYKKKIKLFNGNVAHSIVKFIDGTQNYDGGFTSNRSQCASDPYHSYAASLSYALLKDFGEYTDLIEVDPLFAIPKITEKPLHPVP